MDYDVYERVLCLMKKEFEEVNEDDEDGDDEK
jgi:hypothetical protein